MDNLGSPIFDADTHMYETTDALLRHLPAQYKHSVQFVQIGRQTRIAIAGKISQYIPNPTFERVAAPGAHEIYHSGNNTEGKTLRELTGDPIESIPAFRAPAPRLEKLDEQGVQASLTYPTLANLVEHSAQDDPKLVHAIIHSLNEWMAEEWSFNTQDRIFTTPVITLGLVDRAIAELEWVLERGARAILIRPAPVRGFEGFRSPALPEFDPFWARVQESGISVVMHSAQPVLDNYVAMWEPMRGGSAFEMTPFKVVALGHRDIADMVTALICHGTLTRFPALRLACVESGSDWIAPLLHDLSTAYTKMPQEFAEHPVDVWKRNFWINPFWEGSVNELRSHVDVERIIFGSDYPHPEGLQMPMNYFRYLEGVSDDIIRKVMGENAYSFMNIPVPTSFVSTPVGVA